MSKIIKSQRKNGFTIISNTASGNGNLSLKALGLLTAIMKYPQDWDIRVDHLASVLKKDGKTSIYSAIKELIEEGYMKRIRVHENGRFARYDYIVSDERDFSILQQDSISDLNSENSNTVFRKPEYRNTEFRKPERIYNIYSNKEIIETNNTVDLKVDGAGKESKPTIAKTQKEVEATPAIAKTKEKTDDAPKIIELLNEITGRAFRPSGSSLRPIRARLREGFTMDDFTAVIRLKNAQWANRADMRQYLRPETLFGNKFDSYLQEAKALAATKIPVVEGETDEYRKYVRWAETYFTYLGANLVLDERTFTDITKGKAFDNHRCLLPKNTLSALFKDAHRLCNEQMGRTGTCKGIKQTYIELINQAIK